LGIKFYGCGRAGVAANFICADRINFTACAGGAGMQDVEWMAAAGRAPSRS